MTEEKIDSPILASPQHRLGAIAVDAGLMLVTSFIGWEYGV